MLIVPRNTPGIAMTRLPKIGNNAMPSWDISFDAVWVSRDSLLGELHQGFKVLGSTLHYSRASLAATCTGCAQSIIDMTIAHIKERHQFGHPLADFQVVRHRIADMQMRVDQSRLTVRHLAWLISTQLLISSRWFSYHHSSWSRWHTKEYPSDILFSIP